MLTLDRAISRNASAGESLRFQWNVLNAYATPRRGQVTMVYGPSGSCKSMFALNYVLQVGLPTLYFSPDTDQHDMAIRCMCLLEGQSSKAVEEGIAVGALKPDTAFRPFRDWLRFTFDPAPTIDDLDLELMAFDEQFGAPPAVVVVDNLSDVHENDEDEFRGFRKTMAALHVFARATNALVIVLHHTTGEYDGITTPAPRRGINGKLSKVPELILSTAVNGNHFGVAVVKQRSGYQDPRAENPIWLSVDATRSAITDRPATPPAYTSWTD